MVSIYFHPIKTMILCILKSICNLLYNIVVKMLKTVLVTMLRRKWVIKSLLRLDLFLAPS